VSNLMEMISFISSLPIKSFLATILYQASGSGRRIENKPLIPPAGGRGTIGLYLLSY